MCNKKNVLFFRCFVYLFLIFIIIFSPSNSVIAFENLSINQSKLLQSQLNLSIILDQTLYTNIEYNKLFRVDNLLYPKEKQNAVVNYSLVGNDILNKNYSIFDSFEINSINKYKSANTGKLYLEKPGNYTICGNFFQDNNLVNFSSQTFNITPIIQVCKNISILDLSRINCDHKLGIKITYPENSTSLNKGDKLDIQFLINSSLPYDLEYWIDDIFQEKIKQKMNTSSSKKQYTIRSEKEIDLLFINAILYPLCNDTNISNNNLSKQLVIVNSNKELLPKLTITKIYNENKLKFGKNIRVKINVIKINSTKNSIKAYVVNKDDKKVSEITQISLFGKDIFQELLLYIELKNVCSKGKHYLVIEGFDMEDKKALFIVCDNSKDANEKKESKNSINSGINSKTNIELTNNSPHSLILNTNISKESLNLNQITADNNLSFTSNATCFGNLNIHYQGKSVKINHFIKYFLIGLLIFNIIVVFLNKY
jgi:hypothetical protein